LEDTIGENLLLTVETSFRGEPFYCRLISLWHSSKRVGSCPRVLSSFLALGFQWLLFFSDAFGLILCRFLDPSVVCLLAFLWFFPYPVASESLICPCPWILVISKSSVFGILVEILGAVFLQLRCFPVHSANLCLHCSCFAVAVVAP
jgi:hypothetical protein